MVPSIVDAAERDPGGRCGPRQDPDGAHGAVARDHRACGAQRRSAPEHRRVRDDGGPGLPPFLPALVFSRTDRQRFRQIDRLDRDRRSVERILGSPCEKASNAARTNTWSERCSVIDVDGVASKWLPRQKAESARSSTGPPRLPPMRRTSPARRRSRNRRSRRPIPRTARGLEVPPPALGACGKEGRRSEEDKLTALFHVLEPSASPRMARTNNPRLP